MKLLLPCLLASVIEHLRSAREFLLQALKVLICKTQVFTSVPHQRWTWETHSLESWSVWLICSFSINHFSGGFTLWHSDWKWPVKLCLKHSESFYLQLSGVWLVKPQRKHRFFWSPVYWGCFPLLPCVGLTSDCVMTCCHA